MQTFLLDNTVLSNFANIKRIELLCQILSYLHKVYTTNLVLEEFSRRFFGIYIPCISITKVSYEDVAYLQRIEPYRRLGKGELSLLVAAYKMGTPIMILTDDRVARKKFEIEGLEVHGTIHLLVLAVCFEILSEEEAVDMLKNMKANGYYFKGTEDVLTKEIEKICE